MKKVGSLFLIVIITIAIIYFIVSTIGLQGFLFAWVLNLMLMMFVMLFTETLKPSLNADYYKEKVWEKRGKIYEQLGIHLFRKLLVIIGWEKLNKKANPVQKNIDALIHLEQQTKKSEYAHIIIFFIVTGFTIYVAIQYSFLEAGWLLFLNIILNVYPVLLQRYNRPRLQRAIKILMKK